MVIFLEMSRVILNIEYILRDPSVVDDESNFLFLFPTIVLFLGVNDSF